MYFTHRKKFGPDPTKQVYTAIANDVVLGRVCGFKGYWQTLGTSGLSREVYPTREAAGEALLGSVSKPDRTPPNPHRQKDRQGLGKDIFWQSGSRVNQILTECKQDQQVCIPWPYSYNNEREMQWSIHMTLALSEKLAGLVFALVDAGVLDEKQVSDALGFKFRVPKSED